MCIRDRIWAGSHLPFAASPLYWWHNNIEEKNLYFLYKALANYMALENRLEVKVEPKNITISGEASDKIK